MEAYRRDAKSNHTLFTKKQREELLEPHLPAPPLRGKNLHGKSDSTTVAANDEQHLRPRLRAEFFLRAQIHALCYSIVQIIFSVYIRIRRIRHAVIARMLTILCYHHRAPELIQKDARGLSRLPRHLSVILNVDDIQRDVILPDDLLDKVADLSAWCACVGIPMLSVYERTGILKGYIPNTHKAVTKKLSSYFGPQQPALSVRAPHVPPIESPVSTSNMRVSRSSLKNLSVILLSADDGRDSLVDLTKTLVEMAQHSKLSPSDISTDLIDTEISESVMGDPDLLVLFTPCIDLSGYPPWQLRLAEIFHIEDNQIFGYHVFLQALYSYENAQMRFGR